MTEIANVFGWCTIINSGLLMFSTIVMVVNRKWIARMHARWFDLTESELFSHYFRYLATFKLMILFFNLAPYIALRIVSR
ncbi:hypothetical protein N9N28_01070 [Rubripirellula amarantea]|nr:hypothetical protein [Rubripirellula amarantea]